MNWLSREKNMEEGGNVEGNQNTQGDLRLTKPQVIVLPMALT